MYDTKTGKEFDELTLDGHNYPTWTMDVKISLVSHGIIAALLPPQEGEPPLQDHVIYGALYIRHHIHLDPKSEYLIENPSTLWLALKSRYEQQSFCRCKS